jgi:gliding motility-associated-like protein
MKKIVSLALLMAFACGVQAQSEVFNIGNGDTYTGCDAIMHDANGGLVPYGPNSNNQTTICPAAPETQVNLYFIGCDIAVGDVLAIYDGPDTSAPLIGEYDQDELLFETISPSPANLSGCLTVTFTSNSDDQTGDFSMRIICGVPCDFPIADIYADADTVKICPGESVEFYGGNSTWTEGATLANFTWDFGDGTTDTETWSVVQHQYNEPGGYRVRLYIEDSNGCQSANIPEVVVLVSTPFEFDITSSEDYFCIGNPVLIGTNSFVQSGGTVIENETENGQSETWIEDNSVVFDNGIYIPDNQGCLETDIVFNQFGTAVIDDVSDFSSIYFNMEHSFVGDITIAIVCPDGSVMSIFPEAGGSGTYLGEPIDLDNGVPGVGYDYSFSPNSSGGTWMEYLSGGGFGTIPAGDYEPEGSFDDLIGCPLNGTWTLEVCDIVGADDGYVFEFGIAFNASFYPDVLQFTPIVGSGCDSSYWVEPNALTEIGPDCDWAIFDPTTPGNYTFQYRVVNDFGCEFTQDITITAVAPPEVNAADVPICAGSNNQLQAIVENAVPGAPYAYSWTPGTGLSSTVIAAPTVTNITEETVYTVTVTAIGLENCQGSDEATVFLVSPLIPTLSPQYDCDAIYPVTLNCELQVNQNAVYDWTLDGNPVLGANNDTLVVNEDGHFQLVVFEAACGTNDTIDFFVAPPLILDDRITRPCTETLPVDIILDDQEQDVIWSWDHYETLSDYSAGITDSLGFYSLGAYNTNIPGVYVIHVEQEDCTQEGTIVIRFEPEECELLIPNIISPNGDGRNDTFDVTSIGRYPRSTCQIYNRWGNLVFEDLDYNGSWNADGAPDGVYYYIVGVNKNTGMEYYSGDLTIIR